MTLQIPDRMILDGEKFSVSPLPDFYLERGRIVEMTEDEFRASGQSLWFVSTACWREYVATWEILDNRLYLRDVAGKVAKIVPDPIFADRVSGSFVLARGRRIGKLRFGGAVLYEFEVHLSIRNGIVESLEHRYNDPEAPPKPPSRIPEYDSGDGDLYIPPFLRRKPQP